MGERDSVGRLAQDLRPGICRSLSSMKTTTSTAFTVRRCLPCLSKAEGSTLGLSNGSLARLVRGCPDLSGRVRCHPAMLDLTLVHTGKMFRNLFWRSYGLDRMSRSGYGGSIVYRFPPGGS